MPVCKLITLLALASLSYAAPSFFTSINGVVTSAPVNPFTNYPAAINSSGQLLFNASNLVYVDLGSTQQVILGGGYPPVFAEGTGLNNSDQVVGRYNNDANSWLYSAGVLTTVAVPGSTETDLFGISSNGVAIGSYSNGISYTGFTYNGGKFTFLDTRLAQPRAINASGVIVGGSGAQNTFGYVYENGLLTYLMPPGASNSYAVSIADSGLVVGWYIDNAQLDHTFFYQDGIYTFTDFGLGRPGFNDGTFVKSMSSDGKNLIGFVQPVSISGTPEPGSLGFTLCAVVLGLGLMRKRLTSKRAQAFRIARRRPVCANVDRAPC